MQGVTKGYCAAWPSASVLGDTAARGDPHDPFEPAKDHSRVVFCAALPPARMGGEPICSVNLTSSAMVRDAHLSMMRLR